MRHLSGEVSETRKLPELVVTKGGVPFEDQAEGIRQFKEACLAASPAGAPDGIWMPFDVLEQIGAEITSLRAQLDGMKRAAEVRDGTVSALNETCVNQGFEIADLKTKLDEARRKAIEECAAIADRWTSPEQRLHGHGGAGAEILALLSESKS